MEILDYLRVGHLRGRWLAVVVALPVLAGAGAFLVGTAAPARYEASGRVALASFLGDEVRGIGAAERASVRFENVFESTGVAEAAATHREGRDRPTSFRASGVGQGLVDVSVSADDDEVAAAALDAAVRETLRALLEAERGYAAAGVRATADAMSTAQARLDELHASLGVADLPTARERTTTEILRLRDLVGATTNPAEAEALTARLEAQSAEQQRLDAAVVGYERWATALRVAQEESDTAVARRTSVETRLVRVDTAEEVMVRSATAPTSQMTQTAVLAIVAMGTAGFTAVLVFGLARRRPNVT